MIGSFPAQTARSLRPLYFSAIATALIAAPLLLAWLGYQATAEWQRSTRLLVEQRTAEVVTLMIMAVSRDMQGVQSQVLPQLESLDVHSAVYELADEIAMAFARFPYPESFFSWTDNGTRNGSLYVFNRTDRPPHWQDSSAESARFPTTILKDPKELAPLVELVRDHASMLTRFVLLETKIDGHTYQVIARLRYGGPSDTTLQSLIGFTVNLGWVRAEYFSELTSQLLRIVSGQSNIALTILDENGTPVTVNRPPATLQSGTALPVREQLFPLFFFDSVLRATVPEGALPVRYWTARAEAVEDQSMLAAAGGARRTFILISLAAVAAGISLVLMARAVRAAALLATMKSEFVSAVTHELKTPLSTIRLTSETLARGRFRSQETIAQYASLLLNEVSRLTRTVDNLLSIARLHDVSGFYTFESVDLVTVVEEVLGRFQPRLKEQAFEVDLDVPASLPPVHADRTAILHVLDNLLDNAMRYSNGRRSLSIHAAASDEHVSLRIADKGPGIPPDELPRVFDKFFRGRDVTSAGSGLGLAIAQRVLRDHGGDIRLHSTPGGGTTAEVLLRVADKEGRS